MADLRSVMTQANAVEKEPELQSGTQRRHEVSRKDLPLYCPPPSAPLWSMHPRVYLPLGEKKEARCPYCGAVYVLKD